MKEQYTDKEIRNLLFDKTLFFVIFSVFTFLLLLAIILNILFYVGNPFIFVGVPLAIEIILIIIFTYFYIIRTNENNWYISKEVITVTGTKSVGDEDIEVIYDCFILYDNKRVVYKGKGTCYFGDTIYVIRNKKNNIPLYAFIDRYFEYKGNKEIIDNTDKYNNEYYYQNSFGKRSIVNDETYKLKDGNKFIVGALTKEEKEKNKKTYNIILLLLVGFWIFGTIRYYFVKDYIKDNWIQTTAIIESRDDYYTTEEYPKYKYGVSYTIKEKKYHSYVVSTHGSISDINKKIIIYIDPNNYNKVKIYDWKTFV